MLTNRTMLLMMMIFDASKPNVNAKYPGQTVETKPTDEVRNGESRFALMVYVESQHRHGGGERNDGDGDAVI